MHIIVAIGLGKGTVVALRMMMNRQTMEMVVVGAMVRLPPIWAVEEGVVPLPIEA